MVNLKTLHIAIYFKLEISPNKLYNAVVKNYVLLWKNSSIPIDGETMEEKTLPKVFIVHGHDEAAKLLVARFIEKLDFEAIILDEQAGGLQAVIDKFEEQVEDIVFAVVLLTPDDIGTSKAEKDNFQPRARQNVILELGYFIAKLDRNQICLLYKESVEFPSDVRGISYVLMDNYDGWQLKLAREMKNAKLPIDANKLL